MPKISVKRSIKKESIADKNAEWRVRTLTLILTRRCNLDCAYCYEKHKNQDEGFMDVAVAKEAIKYFMELEDDLNHVLIDFFGGEPLLAFSLIKRIFEWCNSQHWKKKYHFLIGTNGTLLNDEMKEWFSRHRQYFSMSLSIDGSRTAHNMCRDNSYDLVYPHIEFIKKNWPDQTAKMTIWGDTIPYIADSVIELEEMGLNFTANISFENFWGNPGNKKQLLNIYEEQLSRLVEYYKENSTLYPVYPMLGLFPSYLGIPGFSKYEKKDCVRFCGAGHEMVAVDIDGARYPCHRFLNWVTGKSAPNGPINRQTTWKPDECSKCKIVLSCPTCAGFNWEENNDTAIRTTYHCEAHKLEVLASAQIALEKINKMPLAYLDKMSPKECIDLKQKISALFDLIENGI
ncbi:MAG: radical SAM protein [Candidatus Aminicenantes bacterium]|jgi:radical SAM protein with 4Fe4S-binding SPASM domain